MSITASMVKELREKTGAGMMDCKKALAATDGDMEKAIEELRKKGMSAAAKKAGRTTGEGLVHAYIHPGGSVGVLVEVNCETDFVARTDQFVSFCNDVAMHIAATDPRAVSEDELDAEMLEKERKFLVEQAQAEGKPAEIAEKMVEGRMKKYKKEIVLLEQPFVKDPDQTVGDLVKATIAGLGENIQVKRFSRFQVGA